MKIYKFGGASVKDSGGVRNLARIVKREDDNLIIVVSALAKTTNALERVLNAWYTNDHDYKGYLKEIYDYHLKVHSELFSSKNSSSEALDKSFAELENYLETALKNNYDQEYDQIVSFGEIWSTLIVGQYLNIEGFRTSWVDIRNILVTDDRFRDANIMWEKSTQNVKSAFNFKISNTYITQGFIARSADGKYTTLGREGSDYTAAILAFILDADHVVVWKDVPGLLNADPKWMPDASQLEEVSYREAVEMTFSGAKVIHPKTIKPLHNKNIPLYVKSFINPEGNGTIITSDPKLTRILPVFIRKEKQILLSILPRDFSFVMGDSLSMIFQEFLRHRIKVNLVEASAVSIDVCVDDDRTRIESLLKSLKNEYSVLYNDNTELLSIRHYDSEAVERITRGYEILIEQRTRSTVRFVVKCA